MIVYLSVALFAALVTATSVYCLLKIAPKFWALREVRPRDVHTVPTLRIGGIPMFVAFLFSIALARFIPYFSDVFRTADPVLTSLVIAVSVITLLGFLDDLFELHWLIKLLGQIFSAAIVSVMSRGIFHSFTGGDLSWLLTVASIVLIVTTMNAINFIDGLDGLAAGVCLIGNGVFFVYIYFFTREISPSNYFNLVGLLAAILFGICAGFIPFNWRPAKLFMGDSGALLLGLVMSVAATTAVAQASAVTFVRRAHYVPAFIPILLPFAVLGLPILDLLFAIMRRLLSFKSPFNPDKKHLHHRMLHMGHSSVATVVIFYAWSGVVSVGMLLFLFTSTIFAVLFLLFGVLVCLIFTFLPVVRKRSWNRN